MRKAFLAAALIGLAATSAPADETKVPLDKLPPAVAAAVKKRFPKAELVEAARETENGKTQYEVTLKDGGTKMDVMLSPEGTITLIEKVIAAKDLPKAVAEALAAKYPKAEYKTVEEVIKVADGKETTDYYEVLLTTADKKTYEVKVSPEGKVTGTEEKK